ncbi:MAG: DUF4190 domain-containing protein [Bacteroidetes bacterium]|nr:DUF4190 domain-containing protein [Bacteroidota bacterium]
MNINKIKLIAFLLCIAIAFTQCSVKKRSYRNGYFISWNKKTLPLKSDKIIKQVDTDFAVLKATALPSVQKNTKSAKVLTVSSDKIIIKIKKTVKPLILKDSCGDMITMRDGRELLGKVIEVSPKTIKYKRCDNLDGPLMVVNTNDVFMIKYTNGTKEVFKKDETQAQHTGKNPEIQQPKKYHPLAITSFVVGLLSWIIILAPIALFTGIAGLGKIKKYPEKFEGGWMAIIGIVLGAIFTLILILILIAAM